MDAHLPSALPLRVWLGRSAAKNVKHDVHRRVRYYAPRNVLGTSSRIENSVRVRHCGAHNLIRLRLTVPENARLFKLRGLYDIALRELSDDDGLELASYRNTREDLKFYIALLDCDPGSTVRPSFHNVAVRIGDLARTIRVGCCFQTSCWGFFDAIRQRVRGFGRYILNPSVRNARGSARIAVILIS